MHVTSYGPCQKNQVVQRKNKCGLFLTSTKAPATLPVGYSGFSPVLFLISWAAESILSTFVTPTTSNKALAYGSVNVY